MISHSCSEDVGNLGQAAQYIISANHFNDREHALLTSLTIPFLIPAM